MRKWKNHSFDCYCKQYCKVVETMSHIFKCERTREYLRINIGVHQDPNNYLWPDHKERNRTLAQFAAASFFIPEIMRCRLHGDTLSWRRTRF